MFAHELGHNLGLVHPTKSRIYPNYSVGYGYIEGELQTIMGYGGGIPFFLMAASRSAQNPIPACRDETANAVYALNKVRLDFARISDRRNSNSVSAKHAWAPLAIEGISAEITGPVKHVKTKKRLADSDTPKR